MLYFLDRGVGVCGGGTGAPTCGTCIQVSFLNWLRYVGMFFVCNTLSFFFFFFSVFPLVVGVNEEARSIFCFSSLFAHYLWENTCSLFSSNSEALNLV